MREEARRRAAIVAELRSVGMKRRSMTHRVLAHLLGCAKRDGGAKFGSDSDGVPLTFSIKV